MDADALKAKIVEMLIRAVLYAMCLWVGMKYWGEVGSSFAILIFIAFVSALLGQVRFLYLGYPLSIISMYVLLYKLLDVDFWPDAVIIVAIANIVAWGVGAIVIAIILSNFFPSVAPL